MGIKAVKEQPGDTRTQQKLRAKNAAYKKALAILKRKSKEGMTYDSLKKAVGGDEQKQKHKQDILRSPKLQGIKQAYDEIMGTGTIDKLLRSRKKIAYDSMRGKRSGGPVRKKAKKPTTYNF